MSVKSKTDRADYVFAVKEFSNGNPWLMLEPSNENLNILKNGFLGLEFQEGTSFEEAQKIAEMLNDKIESVSFTEFFN